MEHPIVWFCFLLFHISFTTHFSLGSNSLSSGQSLSGNTTLISPGKVFELGFFTPGNSNNYYIGIWYYKQFQNKTVVWVANRERPVSNPSSSQLKLLPNGNLVLLNQSKSIIWSTNSISSSVLNITLLDNGNLVLVTSDSANSVLWQSFDYPTDHWLPGGKVGYSKVKNVNFFLTSWKNLENPGSSLFSIEVKPSSNHVLVWNRSKLYWDSGEWDGRIFKFVPEIALDYYVKNITYVSNENESYFTYESAFEFGLTRFVIGVNGQLEQFVWRDQKGFQGWSQLWTRPPERCEVYGYCGSFGSCSVDLPVCSCLIGFEPRNRVEWDLGDYTGGCVRNVGMNCGYSGFVAVGNVRFSTNSELVTTVGSLEECRVVCLRNCSCNAFGFDNGCLIWKREMFGVRVLSKDDRSGRVLYVRTFSELVGESEGFKKGRGIDKTVWIVVGSVGFFVLIGCGFVFLLIKRGKGKMDRDADDDSLFVFTYKELKSATGNFSEILGEGGFGSVFKGTLTMNNSSLLLVAVKVIKKLKQGEKQFRSEVSSLGTVHHVNLVRLVGFCVENGKRILVYEYMPSGSLESRLFIKNAAEADNLLDWKTRYRIAIGTAKGLAYLHDGCRDQIIHCDIKPENILLDENYVPKVADFGMAKLLGRDFSRVLTTFRGTRGYLAPEWISGEAITAKADVFSFGMVLFEIISGKRNRDSSVEVGNYDYFPAIVANDLINGGDVIFELAVGRDRENWEEISRVCKVACWCIQDMEGNRPNIAKVIQMLEGNVEVEIPPVPRFLKGFLKNNGQNDQVFYLSSSNCS